jgi:hypothetical protein
MIDDAMIQLQVPTDLRPLPYMNHGPFSFVEDHLFMQLCVKYAPQSAKMAASFQEWTQSAMGGSPSRGRSSRLTDGTDGRKESMEGSQQEKRTKWRADGEMPDESPCGFLIAPL